MDDMKGKIKTVWVHVSLSRKGEPYAVVDVFRYGVKHSKSYHAPSHRSNSHKQRLVKRARMMQNVLLEVNHD